MITIRHTRWLLLHFKEIFHSTYDSGKCQRVEGLYQKIIGKHSSQGHTLEEQKGLLKLYAQGKRPNEQGAFYQLTTDFSTKRTDELIVCKVGCVFCFKVLFDFVLRIRDSIGVFYRKDRPCSIEKNL